MQARVDRRQSHGVSILYTAPGGLDINGIDNDIRWTVAPGVEVPISRIGPRNHLVRRDPAPAETRRPWWRLKLPHFF